LRILLACEESQIVTAAFIAAGHDAMSCDIDYPGAKGLPHHQGDVLEILNNGWDMMIGFPPCTHLAVSNAKHFAQKRKDGRQQQAIDFFMALVNAPIPKICIENPVGIMSSIYKKPTQIVQPWMFGDPYTKTTCLWLKGLPRLNATNIVDKGGRHITKSGKSLPDWYNLPPSEDRARIRSQTFPGLALAMSSQWS